jgi:hypothetical protein
MLSPFQNLSTGGMICLVPLHDFINCPKAAQAHILLIETAIIYAG